MSYSENITYFETLIPTSLNLKLRACDDPHTTKNAENLNLIF